MTNLSFVKHRVELRLKGSVNLTGATEVVVWWLEITGGVLDEVTGAVTGGVERVLSGTLRCFGSEDPSRKVLGGQFQEVQQGDVILDTDAAATVTLYLNQTQSGTVSLDEIQDKGARLMWDGKPYVQAKIGEALAERWAVVVGGQRLYRSLLLRPAT